MEIKASQISPRLQAALSGPAVKPTSPVLSPKTGLPGQLLANQAAIFNSSHSIVSNSLPQTLINYLSAASKQLEIRLAGLWLSSSSSSNVQFLNSAAKLSLSGVKNSEQIDSLLRSAFSTNSRTVLNFTPSLNANLFSSDLLKLAPSVGESLAEVQPAEQFSKSNPTFLWQGRHNIGHQADKIASFSKDSYNPRRPTPEFEAGKQKTTKLAQIRQPVIIQLLRGLARALGL